ncbi:MAG: hypothetical protein WC314_25875 [Vulcanimicrobiota bacterium]
MTVILDPQASTQPNLTTSQLKEPWKDIFNTAQSLAKQAGQLKTMAKKLSSQDGYDSLKSLSKTLEKLEALNLPDPELMTQTRKATQKVQTWLEAEWDRRAREFSTELLTYFRERDVDAQLHDLTISVHPFTLEVQAAKDKVFLYYLGEEVAKAPLSSEKVFKQWQKSRDQLEKNDTPPQALLDLLERAYEEQLRLQQKSAGTRFRLSDLHFRLFVLRQTPQVRQDPRKAKVKEYPRYQFAYDLGLLLEQRGDGLTIETEEKRLAFHQASKSAAQSRSNSMQVEIGTDNVVAISDLDIVEL